MSLNIVLLVIVFIVDIVHLAANKSQLPDIHKFTDLCHQGEVPETVREHYAMLSHHASECIECQLCMPRCPFKVILLKK